MHIVHISEQLWGFNTSHFELSLMMPLPSPPGLWQWLQRPVLCGSRANPGIQATIPTIPPADPSWPPAAVLIHAFMKSWKAIQEDQTFHGAKAASAFFHLHRAQGKCGGFFGDDLWWSDGASTAKASESSSLYKATCADWRKASKMFRRVPVQDVTRIKQRRTFLQDSETHVPRMVKCPNGMEPEACGSHYIWPQISTPVATPPSSLRKGTTQSC